MDSVLIPQSEEPGLQGDQRLLDRGWLRIGAGAAIAGQAMVFSLAMNLSEIDGWAYAVVHGILILAAAGSLVFLGGDLVRSAWESVRDRKIGIDLLFLVTLAGAFAGSLVSTFTHAGSVYYEVVAILIVVHTTGKMLGARSRVAALRAVDATREKFDACDVVQADGSVARVRAGEVTAGSRVRVAPGGAIAVDGAIAAGRGYVQETSMTGEWRPVPRGPGDRVLAGTFSVDGSFEVRADGGARRLDAILGEVERARVAPSRLQAEADRLMAWFLPLVVGASVATFGWWCFHGPWERALFNAMAVLLVACPCAMGLATPVAVWGALARLARTGLVARTGDFIDVLARTDTLCIDKTGTLSAEALAVKAWRTEPAFAGREAWLKAAVLALEEGLAHPLAQALRGTFVATETVALGERTIEPGRGVAGRLRDGAGAEAELAVGEWALRKAGVPAKNGEAQEGKTVFVFVNGEHAATVEFEEKWRAGLVETFVALRELGVEAEVLSGDPGAEQALARVGKVNATSETAPETGHAMRDTRPGTPPGDCHIMYYNGPGFQRRTGAGDCHIMDDNRFGRGGAGVVGVRGGLTPAGKLARVEDLARAGRTVLFAGDGINDASAMSAAAGAVAMRGGAELARASAMAVFVGEDLRFLPQAILLARATRRNIRTNLWFAAAYNLIGVALAAAGALHPVAAALLMVGSSLFVSVRALRFTGA